MSGWEQDEDYANWSAKTGDWANYQPATPPTPPTNGASVTPKLGLALVGYVASIVLANTLTAHYGLVAVGFGLYVTAGTFAAGFALLARDSVQAAGNIAWSLAAVAVGGALSWTMASPRLAVASTVAFLVAEVVDLIVYTVVRKRAGFSGAVLLSNTPSALVDTLIFLSIAGFPVTWATVGGQLVGKLVWATLVPLGLYVVGRSALLRQPVNAEGA